MEGVNTTHTDFRNCDKEGIVYDVVAPYTPQYNDAISTTAFILNRSSTKRLKGTTPEEAWSRNKLDMSHFRIFGSLHVPEQVRRKLDDRALQMVLLGYHLIGAYKLYDRIMGKVAVNRDVMVDETKRWSWQIDVSKSIERNVVMNLEDLQDGESCVIGGNKPKRSQGERHTPQRLNDYDKHFALLVELEPVSFEQDPRWRVAMEELKPIKKNWT
ncbi:hypothetical protein CR513_25199, partial [Mucuna pruriens]